MLPLPAPLPSTGDGEQDGIRPLPWSSVTSFRSGYPIDRNNGAIWAGRGLSAGVTSGAQGRWGPIRLSIQPLIHANENRSFPVPDTAVTGRSSLAYPWAFGDLDWYLRPGGGRQWALDLGDSFVQADMGPLRAGVSAERLWWGPARRYPLLFSGSAQGFPHVYVGTERDAATYLGKFSGEILWGRLGESDWFDADPRNDLRLLSALQIRWIPEFVPGLEVSYSLARHEPLPDRRLQARQLLDLVTGDPQGEPLGQRGVPMGSVAFRLGLPDDGVEVYAEIGRGEGFLVPDPGVSDTGHSQIFVMGFARTDTTASGGKWRLAGEVVAQALELPQPRRDPAENRPLDPPVHGHTNRGQLLGAYVGPGSNAQYLAFDRIDPAWTWGFFLERVRRDDDTYFRTLSTNYGFRGHDVEWTIGARAGGWSDFSPLERLIGPLAGGAEIGLSRRKNRNFTGLLQGDWIFLREWNAWADLYLSWDP